MDLDTLDNTAIEFGLDIENYPGKWRQAKKMAFAMDKNHYAEKTAFQLSCRLFQEMVGEKIKRSLEETLCDILGELLDTSNLTTGAIPESLGFASIKLTGVVREYNIRRVFKKYGAFSLQPEITTERETCR